jgi:hypothetical protein
MRETLLQLRLRWHFASISEEKIKKIPTAHENKGIRLSSYNVDGSFLEAKY